MSEAHSTLLAVVCALAISGWCFAAIGVGFRAHDRLDRNGVSGRAAIVGGIFAGLLSPFLIFHGLAWVGGACRELYRFRFPKPTRLPRARVHR